MRGAIEAGNVTRSARRLIAGLAVVPIGALAVLGFEAYRARVQPRDDYGPVLNLDGGDGPTVVWLGDSTASGVGVTRSADALPAQAAAASGRAQHIVSLSVSGARVGDVLKLQLPHVPTDASVVVIDIGANDVVHGGLVRTYRRHYEQVLAALPRSAKVIMLGVPDMGSPTRLEQPLRAIVGWRGRQFDGAVRDIARRHHATYVDIAGPTGPRFRAEPGRYFFADRYHPNAAGYALWAAQVGPALRGAIPAG